MANSDPKLSVIVIAGSYRPRTARVLEALNAQTARAAVEVIVIDVAPEGTTSVPAVGGPNATVLRRPGLAWGRVRTEGVRRARGSLVAFLEDHCFPAPDWAELIVAAHEGPWAGVGGAFTNANPESYLSRAAIVSDYGPSLHPVPRGPVPFLASDGLCFKRDLLLAFGDRLEDALAPDFVLQEALAARGHRMFLESRALVAHENHSSLVSLLGLAFAHCRLLGAHRAGFGSWSRARRLAMGVAVPATAPVLNLVRLARSVVRRPALWPSIAAALPVVCLIKVWSAAGESLGYMFGAGAAPTQFLRWEFGTRSAAPGARSRHAREARQRRKSRRTSGSAR